MDKKASRLRRSRKARARIKTLGVHRLSVHRSGRHIYAQLFAPGGAEVVAAASTLQGDIRSGVKYTGNREAAAAVGKAIADKARSAGISKVAFDRSGFKYHGRVKALADAARENGLEF